MRQGRYIVEHKAGNRWLTHHGFTAPSDSEDVLGRSRDDAMIFPSVEGAQVWLKQIGMLDAGHNIVPAKRGEANVRSGKALTEYSPW